MRRCVSLIAMRRISEIDERIREVWSRETEVFFFEWPVLA